MNGKTKLNIQAHMDARREARHRTFKRGLVLLEGTAEPISCILQNWSHNGARLNIKSELQPGTRLHLKIFFGELEVSSRLSTVRWSRNGHVGVEFDTPLTLKNFF